MQAEGEILDKLGGQIMTRVERIRNMTVEEIAKIILHYALADDYFCKSDCEWAKSIDSEYDENECLKCCVRWLESEVEERE